MIKTIISSDPFIKVNSMSALYIGSNVNSGATRYNVVTQQLEVFDGYTWIQVTGTADIALSIRAHEILLWADKKMSDELALARMAADSPIIAEAMEKVKRANDELLTLRVLIENGVNNV